MAPPHPARRPSLDNDDTVRVAAIKCSPARGYLVTVLGLMLALVVASGVWFATRTTPMPIAGESEIFHHVGQQFAAFRFAPDPSIVVIDCPSLHQQGLMFDRIAALIEKSGAPHNRVLSETAFKETLVAADLTIGTYYYGNDYSARSLRKFFRLAHAGGLALEPQEQQLQAIARRAGLLARGANGAVISIPQAGSGHRVGLRARAVILRHELSHGAYFTISDYRAFVRRFYATMMTPQERAGFTTFLRHQGYDTAESDLMINETLAYLVFTPDRDYFRPEAVGLSPATIAGLRAKFLEAMPRFWLRPMASAPLPAG